MVRVVAFVLVLAFGFGFLFAVEGVSCTRRGRSSGSPATLASPPVAAIAPLPPRPIVVETVPVANDLPAFVLRGTSSAGSGRPMVFVPGMCAHPVGYVQSFQATAAARGDLVTVQGDVSCGGDGSARRWSADLEAMDRRIEAAFRASGLGEPRMVTLIGYSQGAERAERLVARWPARYSSAILIGSPIVPSPSSLSQANAVVLMAGTLDPQNDRRGAVGPLTRAGVPATFFELPGARHGQMGTDPSLGMSRALDFLEENEKMKRPEGKPVTTAAEPR
jgi:hypothetical protein